MVTQTGMRQIVRQQVQMVSAVAVVAVCFGIIGCGSSGPALGEVTGQVSLDGQPLADAVLAFQPVGMTKGSPSFAKTDASGKYRLEYAEAKFGAVPGTHLVRITTERFYTDESGKDAETKERLPAIYNSKSEETREVKPGENQFDFALNSKAKKTLARK